MYSVWSVMQGHHGGVKIAGIIYTNLSRFHSISQSLGACQCRDDTADETKSSTESNRGTYRCLDAESHGSRLHE